MDPKTLPECSSQTQTPTRFNLNQVSSEVRPKPGAKVIRILTVSCQKRSHENEAYKRPVHRGVEEETTQTSRSKDAAIK
nr:hypothetical protein [Cytophagales bacterium]